MRTKEKVVYRICRHRHRHTDQQTHRHTNKYLIESECMSGVWHRYTQTQTQRQKGAQKYRHTDTYAIESKCMDDVIAYTHMDTSAHFILREDHSARH